MAAAAGSAIVAACLANLINLVTSAAGRRSPSHRSAAIRLDRSDGRDIAGQTSHVTGSDVRNPRCK